MAGYARAAGSNGILFTCSAFGAPIEAAAATAPIPILKPNEAKFNAAFALADRLAMITTSKRAAAGMEEEFRAAAPARGSGAQITSHFCVGAFDARRAVDDAAHDRLVAQRAAGFAGADVILLGQFSKAGAAGQVRAATDRLVLTSPDAAILEMRRSMEDTTPGSTAC